MDKKYGNSLRTTFPKLLKNEHDSRFEDKKTPYETSDQQ